MCFYCLSHPAAIGNALTEDFWLKRKLLNCKTNNHFFQLSKKIINKCFLANQPTVHSGGVSKGCYELAEDNCVSSGVCYANLSTLTDITLEQAAQTRKSET